MENHIAHFAPVCFHFLSVCLYTQADVQAAFPANFQNFIICFWFKKKIIN